MRSSEDERMLIYCSNDFHFFLPTYDEAVNNRSEPTQPPSFDDVVNNGEQSNEGILSTFVSFHFSFHFISHFLGG